MSMSMRFLLLASLYGIISMIMGMVMGSKGDYTLSPVHTHLSLLGWIAISIYGLAYKVYPQMAASNITRLHFYIVNLGVILLIPSLALLLMKNTAALPFLLIGESLTITSLFLFLLNLWRHRKE